MHIVLFDKKWSHRLEAGYYGLAIDCPLVTEYLDAQFQELESTTPGFTYSQIKLKFDNPCVYLEPTTINTNAIEKEVKRLLQCSKLKAEDKVTYSDGHKTTKGIIKEILPCQTKAFVVYHCNDDWHNFTDYTAACTKLSMLTPGW